MAEKIVLAESICFLLSRLFSVFVFEFVVVLSVSDNLFTVLYPSFSLSFFLLLSLSLSLSRYPLSSLSPRLLLALLLYLSPYFLSPHLSFPLSLSFFLLISLSRSLLIPSLPSLPIFLSLFLTLFLLLSLSLSLSLSPYPLPPHLSLLLSLASLSISLSLSSRSLSFSLSLSFSSSAHSPQPGRAELRHPNILPYLSVFTVDDSQGELGLLEPGPQLWILTPLCDQGSAFDLLSYFPEGLPERAISYIVRAVVEALSYMHSKGGYIHRAVKASHVLLCSDGRVLLTGKLKYSGASLFLDD